MAWVCEQGAYRTKRRETGKTFIYRKYINSRNLCSAVVFGFPCCTWNRKKRWRSFFFDSPGNTAATAAERKAEESGWETVSKHTNNTLCGVMNPPWFILYLYNFDPLDHGCRLLFFGFFLFPTGCVRRQESRRPREIQWKRNKRKTKRHRNYLCDVLPPPFLLKQHFVICLREIKVRYIF